MHVEDVASWRLCLLYLVCMANVDFQSTFKLGDEEDFVLLVECISYFAIFALCTFSGRSIVASGMYPLSQMISCRTAYLVFC